MAALSAARDDLGKQRLPRLIIGLCVLQPILNALSFFQDRFDLPNLTTLLRAALLLTLVLVGFWFTTHRWRYMAAFGVMGLYWAGHMYVCTLDGYSGAFSDFSMFLRVVQLPATAMTMIALLRYDHNCFRALLDGLFFAFMTMLVIQCLSLATGTEPYTYLNKQIGYRGWALLPSCQSAILSLLTPISVYYAYARWGKRQPGLFAMVTLAAMLYLFAHGTRLAYLCMGMTGVGLSVSMLILKQPKKTAIALLAFTAILVAALPISPMYRNQQAVSATGQKKDALFQDLLEIGAAQAQAMGLEGQAYELARLEPAYRLTLNELVERYGMEIAAEAADHADNWRPLSDSRPIKTRFNRALIARSHPLARWFGISSERLQCGAIFYDCENDFPGILFRYGYVGFGLLVLMLGYFAFLILKAMLTRPKRYFTLPAAAVGISLLAILAHAIFTGGVLRAVDVNFFFGAVLALAYYLVRIDPGHRDPMAQQEPRNHEAP